MMSADHPDRETGRQFAKRVAVWTSPITLFSIAYVVLAVAAGPEDGDGFRLLQYGVGWAAGAAVVARLMWLRHHERVKRHELEDRLEQAERDHANLAADFYALQRRVDAKEKAAQAADLLMHARDVLTPRQRVADVREIRRKD